jgi:hypothetical protein
MEELALKAGEGMTKPVDWQAMAVPLDMRGFDASSAFLRRWLGYEQLESGLLFLCEAEAG